MLELWIWKSVEAINKKLQIVLKECPVISIDEGMSTKKWLIINIEEQNLKHYRKPWPLFYGTFL